MYDPNPCLYSAFVNFEKTILPRSTPDTAGAHNFHITYQSWGSCHTYGT